MSESCDVLHACYGGQGGEAAVIVTLTSSLNCRGIRSGVIAIAPPDELMGAGDWPGPEFVVLVPLSRRADLTSMAAAVRAVRRLRPEVVFCHTHRHAPALFLGQLLSGRWPRIVTVEHPALALRTRRVNVRSALALTFSRAVVFLNDDYRENYPLRRWPLPGMRRIAVIPNGVEVSPLPPTPTRTSRLNVGMAARLVPEKDHATLIRAFARIIDLAPERESRLILAGSGPTEPALRALAADLGIDDVVDFVGHLDRPAMASFYAELDVYAHSAFVENACVSLLEAAGAGVPVVASDVPGVRGFIDDGRTGILVDPGNADAMAEGILRASLERESLALGGHGLVESRYSADAMADGYLKIASRVNPRVSWRPRSHSEAPI